MPDLAELEATRTPLPYTTGRADYTVSVRGNVIHLNHTALHHTDVLDLSVALRVAGHGQGYRRLPLVAARSGYTVTVCGCAVYLNARPLTRTDALDLSAALARAVNDTIGALR
jgi:hypothetical protein